MPRLFLFNKPFRVMSQFSAVGDKATLADHIDVPDVYPAGRLDYDSEGLLLLTDAGFVQHALSHPRFKMAKAYWVQVEGAPTPDALAQLARGVTLKDGPTLPAEVTRMEPPDVWARHPPIRERRHIPDTWLSLTLREGRNRQVRRMTAAVGYPTLRLIRWRVGPFTLAGMSPGALREVPCPPHRRAVQAWLRG